MEQLSLIRQVGKHRDVFYGGIQSDLITLRRGGKGQTDTVNN